MRLSQVRLNGVAACLTAFQISDQAQKIFFKSVHTVQGTDCLVLQHAALLRPAHPDAVELHARDRPGLRQDVRPGTPGEDDIMDFFTLVQ